MPLAQRGPRALQGLRTVGREVEHHRLVRQVVEEGVGRIEEERQPALDAGRCEALADAAVERATGRIAFETGAPAASEGAHRVCIERQFTRRQQAQLGHRLEGALRLRIEAADGFDAVVEEVDAQRRLGAHREHIEQRAAHRELARRGDLRHGRIAGLDEAQPEGLERERIARRQREAARRDPAARGQPLQQRIDRDEDDAAAQVGEPGQGLQSLGDDVGQRRELVPGQHFPVGQRQHRQALRCEEREFGAAAVEAAVVGFDDDPRALIVLRRLGERERCGAATQAGPAHRRAPGCGDRWPE